MTTLSDFLGQFQLGGRCWCYLDVRGFSGFSIPPSEAVLAYAVLHGSIRIAAATQDLVVATTGDVVFVLSGGAHAVRSEADSPVRPLEFLREGTTVDAPPSLLLGDSGTVSCRILAGRLDADWPRTLRRKALPTVLHLKADSSGPRASLLRADAMQTAGIGSGSAALLTRLAALMLVEGLRDHPQSEVGRLPDDDPVARALELIADDPAADWSVDRLARDVGMGRSNFAARFRERVGRAPMDMVIEHRMERAAELLKMGDLKIAEVGLRVGYSSEAAFSRRFTRHFGVSPSQVRQQALSSIDETSHTSIWQMLLARDATNRTDLRREPQPLPVRAVVNLTRFSA